MKMKWWEQMKINMVPMALRKVWLSISSRLSLKHRTHTHEDGLLKLHDDVQTCEYQDVQIMWEILQRSETEQIENQHHHKHLPLWRVFVWSNHS